MKNTGIKKSIVLIGPSSVGKSLISTELSKKLSMPRICIDNLYNYVVSEIENEVSPNETSIAKYQQAFLDDLMEIRKGKGQEDDIEDIEIEKALVEEFIEEYRQYNKMLGSLKPLHKPVKMIGSGFSSADEVEYNIMLAKLSCELINYILEKVDEPVIIDTPMSFGWGAPRFGLTVNSRIWLATRFNIEIEKFNQEMRQMLLSLNPVFLMPGKDYEQRNGAVISPANTIILDNMECYMQETGIVVSTNGLFTDPSQPILKRRTWFNTEEFVKQGKLRNNGEISNLCDQIAVGLYELESGEDNEIQ